MNTFCQPVSKGAKEDAMFEPVAVVGLKSGIGSQMTRGVMVEVEGVREGTSSW